MSDALREKESFKTLLTSDINGKTNRLKQIGPMIGNIRDAAKPLLDALSIYLSNLFTYMRWFRSKERGRGNTGKSTPSAAATKRVEASVHVLRSLQQVLSGRNSHLRMRR